MADSQSIPPIPPNCYAPIAGHDDGAFPPGTPLYQSTGAPSTVNPARSNGAGTAFCVGLARSPGVPGSRVITQFAGPLELTVAEWDAIVTGGSGGLIDGQPYYLSSAADGKLVTTKPVATGTFQTLVGIGLSATTLMVQMSQPIGPHA